MRLYYTLFILFISNLAVGQKNDREDINLFYVKMEVLKPLGFIGSGYVIEPELSWQHQRFNYSAVVGLSRLNDQIYKDELKYENTGHYFQGAVQYKFAEMGGLISEGFFAGIGLSYSEFEERGTLLFPGRYFDDYRPTLVQKNSLFGVSYLVSLKGHFSRKWMVDVTARISTLISKYKQPEFPIYYVPGNGFINLFEKLEQNNKVAWGLSVKLGYKL